MTNNQETILKATNTICDVVKSTLGTNGRTVLFNTYIEERDKPGTTKDGATAAKYLRSEDPYENMVISILRESSLKTMLEAGDGTTTTCIIAQYLINKGIDLLNTNVSYYDIAKGIDAAVKDIVTYVTSNTTYVNDDLTMLKEIASTSSNDEAIGELIYNIISSIGVYGNIKVDKSAYNETKVETVKGFKMYKGWMDASMCNDYKNESFVADNCFVLVYDDELRDWNMVVDYMKAINGAPLLVFCEEVSSQILMKLRNVIASNKYPICLVYNDGYGDRKKILLEDISILTGATVLTPIDVFSPQHLGLAKKVIVGPNSTSVMGGNCIEEEVSDKIEEIRDILESNRVASSTELSNMEKLFHQRRLANYAGGVSVISVGGRTEIEMKELKDRIDDAVLAVECAVREGVSLGGGTTFLKCKKQLESKIESVTVNQDAYKLVLEAIEAPFKQLLINSDLYGQYNLIKTNILEGNSYDLRNDKYYSAKEYKVYDATAVLKEALLNASAVAKSLLSVKEMLFEGVRKI